MTSSGFTVDDREFAQALDALMKRWSKNSRAGVRRYGDAVVTFARSHIDSKSGELAGSIGVEDHLEENPPFIEVGAFETEDPKLRHAAETEFGTSKETARPFLRPSLEEAVRDFTVDE
jgi:hypothetical protein